MSGERENGVEALFDGRSIVANFDAAARPVLTVDVAKYQSWLDDSTLSSSQKDEFLRSLWSIVVTFVEIGFDVHPLQEVCVQDSVECFPLAKEAFDQVNCENSARNEDGLEDSRIGEFELE